MAGIYGVELVQADLSVSQSSSLGAVLLTPEQVQSGQVSQLRQEIRQQLPSCPATITLCSKEGYVRL